MNLPNDIKSCHQLIRELVSIVDRLTLRVKELESQLTQNSRNSNFPSSQGKNKPKPAFPQAKGGKIGGEEGHEGGTLQMVSAPDEVRAHTPEEFVATAAKYMARSH